uniref:putative reverse transcriptase/maturase n=1 Tax=Glaucosphaera vacuolata TaxID=38265 RepID=UPI001FCE236B|nr:putative reverse transcriptase/maturase [Glaucosphaera vacuolata]UNJ18700.1 putative reverse transcriptase/maturase [Glaucosphaera vacuolata]
MTKDHPSLIPSRWTSINWNSVRQKIFKAQCKIFFLTKTRQRQIYIQKLQKIMIKSKRLYTFCIYDGIFKSMLTPHPYRISLLDYIDYLKSVEKLHLFKDSRKYIKLKKNTFILETLQLLKEKAIHLSILIVLEPEWEAKYSIYHFSFRPASYSFDFFKVFKLIFKRQTYCFIGTLQKSMGSINPSYLMLKVDSLPIIKKISTKCLQKDSFSNRLFYNLGFNSKTIKKIYIQYGLYPLCMNISLCDFNQHIKKFFIAKNFNIKYSIIRYGDLVVILSSSEFLTKDFDCYLERYVRKNGTAFIPFMNQSYNSIRWNESIKYMKVFLHGICFYIYKQKDKLKKDLMFYPSVLYIRNYLYQIKNILKNKKASSHKILIKKLKNLTIDFSLYYNNLVLKNNFIQYNNRLLNIKKSKKSIKKKYFYHGFYVDLQFTIKQKHQLKVLVKKYANKKLSSFKNLLFYRSPFNGSYKYWCAKIKSYPLLYKEFKHLYFCSYTSFSFINDLY